METYADIIKTLGGYEKLAGALGLPRGTVSAMRTRSSIAPEYWPAVAAAAAKEGHPEITIEYLAGLRRSRPRRSKPIAAQREAVPA